jgi:hypothetical protein
MWEREALVKRTLDETKEEGRYAIGTIFAHAVDVPGVWQLMYNTRTLLDRWESMQGLPKSRRTVRVRRRASISSASSVQEVDTPYAAAGYVDCVAEAGGVVLCRLRCCSRRYSRSGSGFQEDLRVRSDDQFHEYLHLRIRSESVFIQYFIPGYALPSTVLLVFISVLMVNPARCYVAFTPSTRVKRKRGNDPPAARWGGIVHHYCRWRLPTVTESTLPEVPCVASPCESQYQPLPTCDSPRPQLVSAL